MRTSMVQNRFFNSLSLSLSLSSMLKKNRSNGEEIIGKIVETNRAIKSYNNNSFYKIFKI